MLESTSIPPPAKATSNTADFRMRFFTIFRPFLKFTTLVVQKAQSRSVFADHFKQRAKALPKIWSAIQRDREPRRANVVSNCIDHGCHQKPKATNYTKGYPNKHDGVSKQARRASGRSAASNN